MAGRARTPAGDIPGRILVGHTVYVVEVGSLDMIGSEVLGAASQELAAIRVRPVAPAVMRETLLHEVMHTCNFINGVKKDLGDEEEKVVDRIAPLLLMVLRQNPELVAFLVEGA